MIQPDIALGIKQPDANPIGNYLGIVKMAQDVAASKQAVEASKASQAQTEQATQNLAAENPGIAADSAIKARAAAANQALTELGAKYVTPVMVQQKLSDGTPALDSSGAPVMVKAMNPDGTPQLTVNHVGLANEMAQRGFYKESQSLAANDLANASSAIKNATDQQSKDVATAEFTQKATQHVAQLLENAPPDARQALLNNYATYAEKLVPGSGQQLASTFTEPDAATGVPVVKHDRVKAVYDGAMSALEAGNLAIAKTNAATGQANAATSREAVAQSGVQGLSGAGYRGVPPSPEEVAFAKQNGFPYSPGMDRATLFHLPGLQEAYQARVISGQEKAAAQGAVTESQTQVARYNQAQSAVQKLMERGLLNNTGTIGSQLSNLTSRMGNDPDVRAAMSAVGGLQDPGVNPEALSAQAMSSILTQKAKAAQATANVAAAPLKAVTHDQIQPAQAAAAGQPSVAGDTVRVVHPNGKIGTIPRSRLQEALKAGYKTIGGGQ